MGSSGDEVEEGGVDHVGVGPGDVVRAAFDGDELQVLDQSGQPGGGGRVGQDPVGVAVHQQHRDVDVRKVAAEVGQPRVDARVGGVGGGGHGDVVAVVQEILEVRRPVRDHGRLDPVEHGLVHAVGVVGGLEQERRDGAHQHRFTYPG